jgi:DeoR/GlpR family transcriptional regulator of sugar metabolism
MRNAEVIRQWSILRDLESSRRVTIDDLAERTGVSTRTIRRDLEALQSAGFPLFDEVHDGKKYWTSNSGHSGDSTTPASRSRS